VLFVLGKGFDPRMCLGLAALMQAGGAGRRHVLSVTLEEGPLSPSRPMLIWRARTGRSCSGSCRKGP
jgi:hypothetical protein